MKTDLDAELKMINLNCTHMVHLAKRVVRQMTNSCLLRKLACWRWRMAARRESSAI